MNKNAVTFHLSSFSNHHRMTRQPFLPKDALLALSANAFPESIKKSIKHDKIFMLYRPIIKECLRREFPLVFQSEAKAGGRKIRDRGKVPGSFGALRFKRRGRFFICIRVDRSEQFRNALLQFFGPTQPELFDLVVRGNPRLLVPTSKVVVLIQHFVEVSGV